MKTLGLSRGWRVAGIVATLSLTGIIEGVISARYVGFSVLGMAFGAFTCWWWSR